VGWRSPGRAETIEHRHGQSTDGDCVQALPGSPTQVAREFFLAEHGREPVNAQELTGQIAKDSRPRTQTRR
jgi:hypothetical protein